MNDLLIESSLGRVLQHTKKHEQDPNYSWAMMSSWRSELSDTRNIENFAQLKRDVRSMGYGFIELEGVGQEEDGGVSEEPSLFIPEITLDDAQKLARTYDQFAIVYQGPETDQGATLIERDGSQMHLGTFRPNRMAQFFSRLKGRPFTFEGARPANNFERLAEYKHRQKLSESAMMKEGGWISPRGEILLSTQTHAHDITANPELFGFTREYVEELHQRHNERFGQEGEAREQLIVEAVKRGWVRFRRYVRNPSRWSFTVNRLDRRARNLITDFFREAVNGIRGREEKDVSMSVYIVELANENVNRNHTVQDILQFSLLESDQEFEHTLVIAEWKDVLN